MFYRSDRLPVSAPPSLSSRHRELSGSATQPETPGRTATRSTVATGLGAVIATLMIGAHSHGAAPAPTGEEALFTQAEKHEHGVTTLDIVIEGTALTLGFSAPAIDLLGFERAPRNAVELAKMQEVKTLLSRADRVVGLPAEAGCSQRTASLSAPEWPAAADSAGTAADHDHDHDHDHEGEREGTPVSSHKDFDARYELTCRDPAKLTYVDALVRAKLQATTRLEVRIVTPAGQSARQLASGQSRITLR